MPGMTLEELQAKYPPADHEVYDQARARALLAGGLAELVYAMRSARQLHAGGASAPDGN